MNAEFIGGIVFAAVVVFIAYRIWKIKTAPKAGGTGVGGGVKQPPSNQK